MTRNPVLRLGGLAAATGGLALSTGLLWMSRRWIEPERVSLDVPLRAPVEEARFTSVDGVSLYGWLLDAGPGTPAVVCCHGYQRSIEETFPVAYELFERGFTAFVFDFRGCGRSGGRFTTLGHSEAKDLLGAVRYVQARTGAGRVGVYGISMGGAVAMVGAAHCEDVACLVTDSAFAVLDDCIECMFQARPPWQRPLYRMSRRAAEVLVSARSRDVRPLDHAARVAPRPALLIHGTADDVVPFHHSDLLLERLGVSAERWVLEGGAHAMARFEQPEEYLERVTAFLSRHLA